MKHWQEESAFTLLEVMISLAILVVILAAAFLTQGSSAGSSVRNKNVIIATNLARNLINQLEVKYENMPFDRLPKTESKNFDDPHKDFKWTLAIEEVDFSPLSDLLAKQTAKEGESGEAESATVLKLFKDYLQKSVRRMSVTIEWPEGTSTTKQTFTELLVNYDAEFAPGM